MKIEVEGVRYSGFVSANVTMSLDVLGRTFGFEATAEEARPLPIRQENKCRVYVDDELTLTGVVELVNVDGDSRSHVISIQGRDDARDVIDSELDSAPDLGTTISLKRVMERVIKGLGSSVRVVDEARPRPFQAAEDVEAPEPGDNVFSFFDKLARKRQVLLTSNERGDVVITKASGVVVRSAAIKNKLGDDAQNNVIRFSVSYDSTGRFNAYKSLSQQNLAALDLAGDVSISSIVCQGEKRVVRDSDIRRGRQKIISGESSYSSTEDEKRARWERNVRRARGVIYSATVSGYRHQGGDLWDLGQVVSVEDDLAGVSQMMMINSITFSLNSADGRSTTLGLVQKDAYDIALREPVDEDLGIGLVE